MEINYTIARNLNKLRLERNLSMGQLSKLCDVSKVMLSQIEKGSANPTINTLWKIAKGLNVPYTLLLEEEKSYAKVVTKIDTVKQSGSSGSFNIYHYYQNTPSRNFELFQMELGCGKSYVSIGHPAKAEEYLMVIIGILELEINGEVFTLNEDDSISFDASAEHIYRAIGEKDLMAVLINYYPV